MTNYNNDTNDITCNNVKCKASIDNKIPSYVIVFILIIVSLIFIIIFSYFLYNIQRNPNRVFRIDYTWLTFLLLMTFIMLVLSISLLISIFTIKLKIDTISSNDVYIKKQSPNNSNDSNDSNTNKGYINNID